MHKPRSCTECGHPVSEHARFCERCGAALRAGVEPLRAPEPLAEKIASQRSSIEGERKQVTVMFIDIVQSMELTRSLETERWGIVLDQFLAIACPAIHEFEGTVNQFTGDGVLAVFGAPVAHEDHARRACLAALRVQERIVPFAQELAQVEGVQFAIRCGLNSGEVIVGSIGDDLHMEFAPIGNTSGLAKRVESLAPTGSTAVSAATASLVEREFELSDLGEFDVKGVREPQRVFELRGRGAAHSRLEAAERRGFSRFVGRDAERAKLEAALERALAGDGSALGIVGEAGVGKSRLCREFVRSCRDRGLSVDSGSAVAHGRAVPLLPALAMFRDFFEIAEDDDALTARERIESVLRGLGPTFESDLPLVFDFLGVPDPERPVERIDPEARQRRLLEFVHRLVAARSEVEPGVIVAEDLHWLDEASAAFMEALVNAAKNARTLILATFRPEYEATWLQSSSSQSIILAPLDEDASVQLLEELLGVDPSLDGLAELIHERTAGNPFFVEEVVRALAETGHLVGERGDYRLAGPLDELVLPPTVQAVLAARIDRLEAREKRLVQTMSVIGKEVPEPILREVTGITTPELAGLIAALEAAEFLIVESSDGQRELAFKHPLTQEVAYASQLSGARARTHARVAEAIERLFPDSLDERAALLAHHSEAAGEGLKAARWHARAAVWVSASSPADGMRHWRRVRDLTDSLDEAPEVAGLGITARVGILSLAWRLGMSHEEAAAIHADSLERLQGDGSFERVLLDMAYAATLFLGRRELEGGDLFRKSSHRAFELGEPGIALTLAWSASFARWVLGPVSEGAGLADHALALAGDDRLAGSGLVLVCPYAGCLWTRGLCLAYLGDLEAGWADYERALELARDHGDLETESYALSTRGVLRAELYDHAPALADAELAVEVAERSGSVDGLVSAYTGLGFARAHARDFKGADEAVGRALEMADERQVALENEPVMLATLARAKLGLGEIAEAREAAERAVAVTESRSVRRLGLYAHIVRSRVLMATEGASAAEAIEHGLRRALALARETEGRLHEPKIHLELAAFARLRGDSAGVEREEEQARRILEEFGAPVETFERMSERESSVGARGVERT